MEPRDGHEFGVMQVAGTLPIDAEFIWQDAGIWNDPKKAHLKLNTLKKTISKPYAVFCLLCSDHPKFGQHGKKPLEWWIEKLAKNGFEHHDIFSQLMCDGTDWHGIIVCRVKK